MRGISEPLPAVPLGLGPTGRRTPVVSDQRPGDPVPAGGGSGLARIAARAAKGGQIVKLLWADNDCYDERVAGAPRGRSVLDVVSDWAVVGTIVYFGAHLIAWLIR
jgi:hypothetical protein